MSTLSLDAAHDLLARLPALTSNRSTQRRVELNGVRSASEPDVEEQQRQKELLEEMQKYQEANDTLRQQLKAVENEMDVSLKRQALPQTEEEKKLAQLEQEVAHLEATLNFIQTNPPPPSDPLLTPSPLAVEDALQSDLLRTISELEKGLEFEQQRAEKERKKGARDVTLLADAEKLHEVLSARVEKMGETERVTAADLINRAEAKAASVSTAFATLMGALVQFIDEKLAKVGDVEVDDGESAAKKAKLNMRDIRTYFKPTTTNDASLDADDSMNPTTPAGKAHVLKQLLENLMNASATTPLDPWLIISGPPPPVGSNARYQLVPPELLDFLMRAGVVTEHPRDGRRVRLVEFGRGVGGM